MDTKRPINCSLDKDSVFSPILVEKGEGLYDTEMVVPGATGVAFFMTPISLKMQDGKTVKAPSHTNLNQSAMLDYPRRFSVRHMSFALECGLNLCDYGQILRNSKVVFTLNHQRHECAGLSDMTIHEGIPLKNEAKNGGSTKILDGSWKPESATYQIEPGMPFWVKVTWPKPLTLQAPTLMACVLEGVLWRPK